MIKFILKIAMLFLSLILFVGIHVKAQTPDALGIVYVKPDPTGTGDGSSWANATSDLHNAIHAAGVQKVFVAIGTYKVGAISFVMKNGVAIYGGFDPDHGIVDLSSTRIIPRQLDGTAGSILDGQRTRPVIWNVFDDQTALDNTAILDGFIIENGRYEGSGNGGAGIRNFYASPVLRNLVIRDNWVYDNGGAIYNNPNSSPVITNVIFTRDTAFYGGAMYSARDNSTGAVSRPVLTNVLMAKNNRTTGQGTAIFTFGECTLNNVTICEDGDAIFIAGAGKVAFNNSIVYGGVGVGVSGGPSHYTATNCLIEGLASSTNGNVNANSYTRADVFTDAAKRDYRLQPRSPAINAGNNSLFTGLDGASIDLAGNSRVQLTTIDMGAYESATNNPYKADAQGIVYVKPHQSGNGNGDSWENAMDNLHAVIHIEGVKTVFVAVGTYKVGANSFILQNGVSIYGGFDPEHGVEDLNDTRILPDTTDLTAGTILDGENIRPVIWNLSDASQPMDQTAVLDGCTLINGYNGRDGGGIYNYYASPTLTNLLIYNNKANYGAGIFNYNASPVLEHIVLIHNTASVDGGAMYVDGSSAPVMNRLTIQNNQAVSGGGIYYRNTGTARLSNAIFTGNLATNNGAAVYNQSGDNQFNNVTIVDNPFVVAGDVRFSNAVVLGDITGSYSAQNSLIKGNADLTAGNLDASLLTFTDVFLSPATGIYSLKSGSPAIDAGNNSLLTSGDTLDLTGHQRVLNGIVDMGAYEYDGTALPVQLLAFTGNLQNAEATFYWQSAEETAFEGYEIQKSLDALTFTKIKKIAAKGSNSQYVFTCPQTEPTAYYRLKILHKNVADGYSHIIALNQKKNTVLRLYPNPASDFVLVNTPKAALLRIYDSRGRLIQQQQLRPGVNQIAISNQAVGSYFAVIDGISIMFVKK